MSYSLSSFEGAIKGNIKRPTKGAARNLDCSLCRGLGFGILGSRIESGEKMRIKWAPCLWGGLLC